MVSEERALPDSFDPQTGKNVLWSAELGTETHATPIIAGGRVYIGTNNGHPRDPAEEGDRGVLMCFDEHTGRFLWQLAYPKRVEDIYFDWPQSGICSPVTVEGERVYFVNNRGVVLCLDASSATNSAAPHVLWQFDLTTGAGIWSHDAAHSSILVHGDYLYLNSGTGVDNTHRHIRTPDAPCLVVLEKRTGRFAARDNELIAPNIFHSTWSSPTLATVHGHSRLFFAAGNGVIYGFETLTNTAVTAVSPLSLHRVWLFDFDPAGPKTNVHRYTSNRRESPSNFFGLPVFHNNRLYVAGGGDIWWGKNEAWLKCIDATGDGDVTTNALAWSYPLQKHVMATPAIYNGLAFIADCGRTFHCVDAETGKACWTHELKSESWASPLAADGKVYLGTRSGTFYIFAAKREQQAPATIDLGRPISSTPTAANGVLYVATMNRLYALRLGAGPR
jgi:outer membrane protein assembly factor BamB